MSRRLLPNRKQKKGHYMNPILHQKKLFVFDMDGTIYLGGRPFPEAIRYIERLRASGRRVLFFTNNSSRGAETYVRRLERLGFSPQPGEILSSGDVTAEFLVRRRAGKSVYLVGTPDLERDFRNSGIRLLSAGEAGADIVVTGFDTTLTYEKLNAACRYIHKGAEFLSTNPDLNCPTEDGWLPDSGSIAALITAATGKKPRYLGKPSRETIEMICEKTGIPKDDVCLFGDRLYTDIALGRQNGVTSVLVMTGETTHAMLSETDPQSLPDCCFESMAEAEAATF